MKRYHEDASRGITQKKTLKPGVYSALGTERTSIDTDEITSSNGEPYILMTHINYYFR